MSEFSGKCDFYDWFYDRFDTIKDYNVYLNDEKLNLEKQEDCVPYYGYIVAMACGKEIHLSQYPWLRRERERYGIMRLHYYYRQKLNEECAKYGVEVIYSENECDKNFLTKTSLIGDLFFDLLLCNNWSRDFMLCKDENNKKYLLYVYKEYYLIVELNKQMLEDMINHKLNIEETFRSTEHFFIGTYDIETDSLILKERNPMKVGKKYFKKLDEFFYTKDETMNYYLKNLVF